MRYFKKYSDFWLIRSFVIRSGQNKMESFFSFLIRHLCSSSIICLVDFVHHRTSIFLLKIRFYNIVIDLIYLKSFICILFYLKFSSEQLNTGKIALDNYCLEIGKMDCCSSLASW